jgi:hypothetical protein
MRSVKYIIFSLVFLSSSILQSQNEISWFKGIQIKFSQKKSKRQAIKREKAAFRELERNYKERQKEHYNMQDPGTKLRMRDGQKHARRQATGRNHSWWHRLRNRL